MFDTVHRFLRRYDMVHPGDTVTCAVSGGADSVALLWCMYLLKEKLDIHLQAAHFNHHLRGAESDRDEQFVRSLCRQFDIPLIVGGEHVVAGHKGLEAAARDARYAFLETIPGKIATAHTADDNAETVLMHMVRGTGLKGLGGISPVRGRVIRPMLEVTRQQVLALLEEYHLSFVEDSSNDTDDFLRNRLRHRVMPLLRQENPRISESMSAMALRLRQDEAALAVEQPEAELSLERLLTLPEGQQTRLIAAFLKLHGVKEPDADHILLVRRLADCTSPSAKACLPGGVVIAREYDRLVCLPEETLPRPCVLPCPGEVDFGDVRIICQMADAPGKDTVCPVGTMVVRSRESGDAIRLAGGSKSLKKLYIDRKIPAHRRALIPVIADDLGVLAVGDIGFASDRQSGAPAVQITFQYKQKDGGFTDAE